jgi:hypothetical protein
MKKASEIVDNCILLHNHGEQQEVTHALNYFQVPFDDLVQTPISALISVLGYNDGRSYFHHESKEYVPPAPNSTPERNVWEDTNLTPVWNEGVRVAPKYFSFFLDTVFPPFHPNHRKKWRPHELLHTLCRFYYHPSMTRFQLYVGARIGELLPVIHWYHLDEILRPRCPKHQERTLYKEFCQNCEDLVKPYWLTPLDDSLIQRAHRKSIEALQHFNQELNAIEEELKNGIPVETRWQSLNASSDAIGYLHGHWNRLTSIGMQLYVDGFQIDGFDYYSTLDPFLSHTKDLFNQLCLCEIPKCDETFKRKQQRRKIQDFAYCYYQELNWLQESEIIELHESTKPLQQYCMTLLNNDVEEKKINQEMDRLLKQLRTADKKKLNRPTCQNSNVQSIQQGIISAFPESWQTYPLKEEYILNFMGSKEFWFGSSLHWRFVEWLESNVQTDISEHYRLEAFVRSRPHSDEYWDTFQVVPSQEEINNGTIRINKTVRIDQFSCNPISKYLGWDTSTDHQILCRNYLHNELAVFPIDEELQQLLIDGYWDECDPELLCELIDVGILVFEPHNC